MPKSTFTAIIILLSSLSLCLISCRKSTPHEVQIETLRDLQNALKQAGVDVKEGEKVSGEVFSVQGQILILNNGQVEVFEFPNQEDREAISETITADGMVVNGAGVAWETKPAIWGSGSLIVVYRGYDGGIILLLSGLMGDPFTYESPIDDQPYPRSVVAAIRFLADELHVNPASVQVLDFTSVEWPDSCLGLPRQNEQCLPMLTPGWRVIMKVSGNVYELHTDEVGDQVRRP
jgi:hypothetical protein